MTLQKSHTPIHIFWIGGAPPKYISDYLSSWRNEFGSSVRFWGDKQVQIERWDTKGLVFDKEAMEVDLLRILTVRKYGGWYVDADSFPLINALPNGENVLLAREDSRRFLNGLFYAPKDNEFLRVWENEVRLSMQEKGLALVPLSEKTGPQALSRAIYSYSLQIGAERTRQELNALPWKSILLLSDGRNCISKIAIKISKPWIIHQAGKTWLVNTDIRDRSNFLGKFFYFFRRSNYGVHLDVLRLLLKKPHLFPRNFWQLHFLYNLDIKVLDSLENFNNLLVKVQNMDDLQQTIRDLYIGGIESDIEIVQNSLTFAGWKRFSKNCFLRPRVCNLIGPSISWKA